MWAPHLRLYGACRQIDEDKNVTVEFIYEPPQSASGDSLQLERGTEEELSADFLAERLGCALLTTEFYVLRNLMACAECKFAALSHCPSASGS